jgi:probable Rubsico expression protein CbbX
MSSIKQTQDEVLVNLQEEYEKRQIQEVLDQLDKDLIGLVPVKTRIKEVAALLLVHRLRKALGLTSSNPGLHMSFTGSPGTGKTTVALKMADILFRLGYVRKGHLITVSRDDLVGQYIGHTAPKTREQLQKAQGGILFIDEAHHLYKPDNERDYGSEAVELLLQVMENQRDDLIIVFSGAKSKIDTFFNSNPGVSSRIGNHVDFLDYNVQELMEIIRLHYLD